MERERADDAAPGEPEQNQTDQQRRGAGSPSQDPDQNSDPDQNRDPDQSQDPDQNQDPDPVVEDDGSVPAKQIHRWKGEGGSWLPSD